MIEKVFEHGLWSSRFVIVLAVFFGLIGAILLFIVASFDVYGTAVYVINTYIAHAHPENFHEEIVSKIIGAVDLYLIAVVMLIFAFGIYELFISKIDAAEETSDVNNIQKIH